MRNTYQIIVERNNLFKEIRSFFEERSVEEVDTSLIRKYSVTDPYMKALSVIDTQNTSQGYLQTSPEYAMKKLLSQGSGDIFQLSKMFRAEEKSPIHALEFTMLEWYRIGFNHFQLMTEVGELLSSICGTHVVERYTYQEVFDKILAIDPFAISTKELKEKALNDLGELPDNLVRDNYLTLLFSEKIEPTFDPNVITFIHSYPISQASLAKARTLHGVQVAERFEVYFGGMELANGFHELTDSKEQCTRFDKDNEIRRKLGYPEMEIDQGLIDALSNGLPNCAGVALGLDRLLMIKLNAKDISEVIISD